MSAITTKDGTQLYNDWGTGQPVVFSHGWPLSGEALLTLNGQDVMREPWKDRRKRLEDLFATVTLPRVGLVPSPRTPRRSTRRGWDGAAR